MRARIGFPLFEPASKLNGTMTRPPLKIATTVG